MSCSLVGGCHKFCRRVLTRTVQHCYRAVICPNEIVLELHVGDEAVVAFVSSHSMIPPSCSSATTSTTR